MPRSALSDTIAALSPSPVLRLSIPSASPDRATFGMHILALYVVAVPQCQYNRADHRHQQDQPGQLEQQEILVINQQPKARCYALPQAAPPHAPHA